MYFLQDKDLSVNSKFELFYENVSTSVNYHAPLRKMNKKEVKFCEKPWITPKIQKLMKYRDKLLKKLNGKFALNVDYCQILARQEEIPQKTSKNISRYFCSSFQGHV